MKSSNNKISFNNEEDAKTLLEKSRRRIDEIDNALFDLISERTSLSNDIALSKQYLGLPIYDKKREDAIHKKIERLSKDNGLDIDIINQIVNMLTILSKNKQKEILKEEC